MTFFRNDGIGVLATVAICSGLLLAAVPAGIFVGKHLSTSSADPSRDADDAVWLSATALTVQDNRGGRRLLATAMKMTSPEDAERICRYIPYIRDRLVTLAADGRIAVRPSGVDIDAAALDGLHGELSALLGARGPKEIFLYDSTHPDRLPKTVNRPVRCEGDQLTGF